MPLGGLPQSRGVCIIPRSLITGRLRHGIKKALDRQSISSRFTEEEQVFLEKADFRRFRPSAQSNDTVARQGTF
jgi:hypothetical protein